jgi:hypothetical protein
MSQLETIGDQINEILILDEKIKNINKQLKLIKKTREMKESQLLETIKKNNLSDKKFRLNNNSIFLFNSSILPPINKPLLEKILVKYIDKINVDFLIERIEEYRNTNRKTNVILKRKAIKEKMSKKNNKQFLNEQN